MDMAAVAKAQTRLAKMTEAFKRMKANKEFSQFIEAWADFLVAGQEIYNYLNKGSIAIPRSRQWFEKKSNERRSDPLLIYLHQARHADEHGIEPIAVHRRGHIGIGACRGPVIIHSMLISGGNVDVDFTALDGGALNVELVQPHSALIPVRNRGNWYKPPSDHLGLRLVDKSPLNVAALGLAYHTQLIEEAQHLSI